MRAVITVYCSELRQTRQKKRGNIIDKFYMSNVYYKILVFVAFLLFLQMY